MTYHLFVDDSAQWNWELRTNAGKIIAISGTRYKSRENCLTSIRAVQSTASANVVDVIHPAAHLPEEELRLQ